MRHEILNYDAQSFQMGNVTHLNNEIETQMDAETNMHIQFENMQRALEKKIALQDEKIAKQNQEIQLMK